MLVDGDKVFTARRGAHTENRGKEQTHGKGYQRQFQLRAQRMLLHGFRLQDRRAVMVHGSRKAFVLSLILWKKAKLSLMKC